MPAFEQRAGCVSGCSQSREQRLSAAHRSNKLISLVSTYPPAYSAYPLAHDGNGATLHRIPTAVRKRILYGAARGQALYSRCRGLSIVLTVAGCHATVVGLVVSEEHVGLPITLPYEFDTSRVFRLLLKGMVGLEVIIVVPGIVYSLLFSHNNAAALALAFTGAVILFFGVRIFKFQAGSVGTITAHEIVVKPSKIYGLRLPGPSGRFSLDQFNAVRVEMMSGSPDPDVRGGPHERIYLVGKDGTPDIFIARTNRNDDDYGISAGQQFGRLLNLPCEERHMPY